MSTPGRARQRALAMGLLLICSVVYVVRGFHDERLALECRDFKTVYGGARCLLHGCDPYDSNAIEAQYVSAGGKLDDLVPFHAHEDIYPPSALALLTPFAAFPWRPGHLLWLVVSTAAFVAGAMLIAELCLEIAPLWAAAGLGLLILTSTTLIMLGQPTQLAIGLGAIALWCIFKQRYSWFGVVCFAVSLAMKPHLMGWVWLYFVLCTGEYRRQAVRVFFTTVLVALPGLLWASLSPAAAGWIHEIPANVAAITAYGMPGDPGPTNPGATSIAGLQTFFSVFRNEPRFYEHAAQAVGALLLGLWLVPALRMQASRHRDYFALASIVSISLLPVYHREYDTRMLLMTYPAFALLVQRGGWVRWATVSVTFLTLVLVTHNWINFVLAHIAPAILARQGRLSVWQTIVWLRPVPVFTSLIALYYLAVLYVVYGRQRDALKGVPATVGRVAPSVLA